MMQHKFNPSDRVQLLPGQTNINVRPGIYTVVRIMPVTSQGCQYRVKNSLDDHERVLDESQLALV